MWRGGGVRDKGRRKKLHTIADVNDPTERIFSCNLCVEFHIISTYVLRSGKCDTFGLFCSVRAARGMAIEKTAHYVFVRQTFRAIHIKTHTIKLKK